MPPRLLFVDDEPAILRSLHNVLYKERRRWDMEFADGPHAALQLLETTAPFDVVISDMRMPGLDGAALLAMVKQRSPGTARIMLSGDAERAGYLRALPAVHALLGKPCPPAVLRSTLERSLAARASLPAAVTAIVAGIDVLQTSAAVARELIAATASGAPGSELAAIVMRDPAITAKVLQLTSFAALTAGATMLSIPRAVAALGPDILRGIATASLAAPALPSSGTALLDAVRRASAAARNADAGDADDAYASALLADLGTHIVELYEVRDVPAAVVGSALLELWGLPKAAIAAARNYGTEELIE